MVHLFTSGSKLIEAVRKKSLIEFKFSILFNLTSRKVIYLMLKFAPVFF